jgi:hypothetical protein
MDFPYNTNIKNFMYKDDQLHKAAGSNGVASYVAYSTSARQYP